jgi:hypothetical protein
MVSMTKDDDQVLPEETTSRGEGSGLEAERPDDTEEIKSPFDPKKIDVITQQRTVGLLMERMEHGEINMSPDFQRRANLWTESQKSALIESMLLRIPIPSLYVSEDEDGTYTVVDGLQRLCAISHFVKVSSLNKSLGLKLNPLRLSNLQSLGPSLHDIAFADLARNFQRRINETELTLHVIRPGTPNNVKFNIFSRINQSGLPLKAQEIRNAIYPGDWKKHVREMAASSIFLESTEGKIKGERLEDHELVLRFAALFSLGPNKLRATDENLDDFLNNFVDKTTPNWGEKDWNKVKSAFIRSMHYAPKIFGKHAFRKYFGDGENRRPINRGLFESQSVAIALQSEKNLPKLSDKRDQILKALAGELNAGGAFTGALLYATGRGGSSNTRLKTLNSIFNEVLNAK